MKKHLLIPLLLLFWVADVEAQTVTSVNRAGFGVDADVEANLLSGINSPASDDWFLKNGQLGLGVGIIDTSGAAALFNLYQQDATARKEPFFRKMSYPAYAQINGKTLIEGIYIRDYTGDDQTSFVGTKKNGMSPGDWAGDVQPMLNKNDIGDMFVHIRRDGTSAASNLWFIGGLSILGTTGDRYYDFELYQTDIFYDRNSKQFYGYGPDAGHTSWVLDPSSGQISVPGDIILTAEFGTSGLTSLQARIWVHKSMLTITPQAFNWVIDKGKPVFDGDGAAAEFGYAAIEPKTAGEFYTGYQNPAPVWAGPFGSVTVNNTFITNYEARQLLEVSVNLSKLGLDPVTLLGGDACSMPFRRILTKTRSSNSFSAELKDFIGPFDLFIPPAVQAITNQPVLCLDVASQTQINVTNPLSTSIYSWSTVDGSIQGSGSGSSIVVNQPGTYIVQQQLTSACPVYAADTVAIAGDSGCAFSLPITIHQFSAHKESFRVRLSFQLTATLAGSSVALERSLDGRNFTATGESVNLSVGSGNYQFLHDTRGAISDQYYFRLRMEEPNHQPVYSKVLKVSNLTGQLTGVSISPNPAATGYTFLQFTVNKNQWVRYALLSSQGTTILSHQQKVSAGTHFYRLSLPEYLPKGLYWVALQPAQDPAVVKAVVVQ